MNAVGMAQLYACPLTVTACSLKKAQTARYPLTQKRSHDALMTFDSDADLGLQLITK